MSMPQFPDKDKTPTREEVINQILSSIAMEELGLSHIINTEGEKLQYALGTIPGAEKLKEPLTLEDLLNLNSSIHKTLDSTMMNQFFLRDKLQSALASSIMQGPPGPPGPINTILDSYDSKEEFEKDHPTGNKGDLYIVEGELYSWNDEKGEWESLGKMVGPEGPQGPMGDGLNILGYFDTPDELPPDNNEIGDAYIVDGVLYIWVGQPVGWKEVENLHGPVGPQGTGTTIKGTAASKDELGQKYPNGPAEDAYLVNGEIYIWNATDKWHSGGSLKGPQGTGTTIKGSYPSKADFDRNPPPGSLDDAYLVDGEIYIWNETDDWHSGGNLKGPEGPRGPAGPESSSYTIVPFASQMAPRTYANNGAPTRVTLLGFSYFTTTSIDTAVPDMSIPLETDGSFNLGTVAGRNHQLVFSMPFNMTIKSIYATVGNAREFLIPPAGSIFPYIQLYKAEPDSNTFNPIPGAKAIPDTAIGPGYVPEATMRPAVVSGLDIDIPAGTRIAIGGLMEVKDDNSALDYYLYYTGSVGMSRWSQ